jgi:hypothetical protein
LLEDVLVLEDVVVDNDVVRHVLRVWARVTFCYLFSELYNHLLNAWMLLLDDGFFIASQGRRLLSNSNA